MLDPKKRERIFEAVREIGILLAALGPLDATVTEASRRPYLLLFAALGVFLFTAALFLERTHPDGR